jgi:hypothetical protein
MFGINVWTVTLYAAIIRLYLEETRMRPQKTLRKP